MQDDVTTLVCLFHHRDQARAAMNDLLKTGLPDSAISLIEGRVGPEEKDELASFEMPDKDYDRLKAGLRDGGVVLAVDASADHTGPIESIFEKHSAGKIDEADKTYGSAPAPVAAAREDQGSFIPLVKEDLEVGKRTVDRGGIRVYRRVIEVPVEESVSLREEHVNVDRHTVDRPATEQDFAFGNRSFELTETAEEAVIGKSARVVEEVVVGKSASERTQTISDSVRHTEVEVEEIPASRTETYRRPN